jgi:hypothetical protein
MLAIHNLDSLEKLAKALVDVTAGTKQQPN